MAKKINFHSELKGGIEATIQGLATAIGPLLLFFALFGTAGLQAGFWATLVTASVVHGVSLLLRGQAAVIPGSRVASLSAYAALVLQLAQASAPADSQSLFLSAEQLRYGLAAGSIMFLVASGLVLLVGIFKLGNVFKMIPVPVTVGISNGTALLLVWLAIQQIVQNTWAAAATGTVMVLIYLFWPHAQLRSSLLKVLPAAILAAGAGVAMAWGLEPLMASGANDMTSAPWRWTAIFLWPALSHHQWGPLLMIGIPGAMTLALLMILETFTTTSILQTRFDVRSNANRELFVLGVSNIVSAVLGGVPSTGSPIRSVSSWIAGGRAVWASATCLAVTMLLIAALSPWLLALPAGVVVGLFLMQSTLLADKNFLSQASKMVRSKSLKAGHHVDSGFWIAFVISLVAVFGNLIWACFMGVGLSCLVILRRVSGNLTAKWAYMDQYRSRRVRSMEESALLTQFFSKVGVLRLSGHLFFGNSVRLTQMTDELHQDTLAVVVDVSEVKDVDTSGLAALTWVIRTILGNHLRVIATGLKRTRSEELHLALAAIDGLEQHSDLDRGLEVCEHHVLQTYSITKSSLPTPLKDNSLLRELDDDEITAVLLMGEVRNVQKGEALFLSNAKVDGIWLLEQGTVSVLPQDGSSMTRLATFGPGQFVGEMGFIDGGSRSAAAYADTEVRAFLLNQDAMSALVKDLPIAALKITRNIARELAHRVRHSSAILTDQTKEESTVWANSSLGGASRF